MTLRLGTPSPGSASLQPFLQDVNISTAQKIESVSSKFLLLSVEKNVAASAVVARFHFSLWTNCLHVSFFIPIYSSSCLKLSWKTLRTRTSAVIQSIGNSNSTMKRFEPNLLSTQQSSRTWQPSALNRQQPRQHPLTAQKTQLHPSWRFQNMS